MQNQVLWERGKIWLGGNAALLRAVALGAFLAASVPALVACSSSEIENDGSTRGTLKVYVATMDDGTTRTEYKLLVGGNEADARNLVFAKPPEVEGGEIDVKVWGDVSGREIIVNRLEVVDDGSLDGVGTSAEAIINGAPYPARSFAYVLINLNGGGVTRAQQGSRDRVPYTEAEATVDVFGTGESDSSTKQWFLENSYGRQDLAGDVVVNINYTMTSCSNQDSATLASTLKPQVDAALGAAPSNYLWYLGTPFSACGWSGLGEVGTPMRPANDTWYNASTSCVVLVQEPAHNFGMAHSSSLRCSGASFANDPSSCMHSEYGDAHDPLGGGCRHTNGWQKAYLGWFGGCNRVKVNQSGTFNLVPIEPACDGIQVLQVPMPASPQRRIARSGGGGPATNDLVSFYYLELRTKTGFDASGSYPSVLVHVGGDWGARNDQGDHTWILDMNTTSTNSFEGMSAGQTFTDPAGGVSFTVQSLDATHATINVTVPGGGSGNTCVDGGTLATPSGPTSCGDAGAGGMGGMSGTGGMGGRAGAGGMGGRGGMGGAGGTTAGGAAGAAGGLAGSAGLGGGAASGGSAGGLLGGAGGLPATGGSAGTFAGSSSLSGAGGAVAVAGSSGLPSGGASAGLNNQPLPPGELESGCGCRVPARSERSESALLLALAGLLAGGVVRRRARRS